MWPGELAAELISLTRLWSNISMTKEAKILIGIAVVVVIGGILLAIFANPQPEQPGAPVDEQSLIRENSHMTSNRDAKVTIVEFGDYQCPACAQAHPRVKSLLESYQGNDQVNFVFRNFPLDSIHPNAHIASEAAEAAGDQDKYWEMHDILFERQNEWSPMANPLETFIAYASEIGLNVDEFRDAVSQRRYADIISADYNDGVSVGVNSTPTFFLNGERLAGFDPEELKTRIDEILASDSTEQPTEPAAENSTETDASGVTEQLPTDEAVAPEQEIDQLPPQ